MGHELASVKSESGYWWQNCHTMTLVVNRLKSFYDYCHEMKEVMVNRTDVGYPLGMEATTEVPGCVATPGRRERKKQRTREALVDAAFRLFQEKGFEASTVEEIADAVDVSSRTFFRYFVSKEDVVLTFQEEQQTMFIECFRARPADEPVVTALKHAAVEVANACEQGIAGFDPRRFA